MVSVIIPSYNHSKYLKQRIDSVLNQTYIDIELIILDDCSPDNSRQIIEEYRNNPKVSSILFNEINSGSVFKQWEKGIELAKGEYIWIAESDDFADKEFLSKMVPIMENDNKIGLIYCNSKIIYESTKNKKYNTLNDLRKNMFNTSLWNKSFTMDGKRFLSKYLSKACVINNASAVIFKSEAIKSIRVDLNEYKYAGDWAVYNNIALNYKISFFNEELSYYRDHQSNASKNAFNNFRINYENYTIISDYYNYLKLNGLCGILYIYSVRRSFLHILILNKKYRKVIMKTYKDINKEIIDKSLIFLPQVYIETSLSVFFNKLKKTPFIMKLTQ